jgi:glycine C-acetyltransferase
MENKEDELVDFCNFIVDSGPFDGYKAILHIIESKQDTIIEHSEYKTLHNFTSNNYSGLAGDSRMVEAAYETMKKYGYGMSSAPLMCGFQDIHKKLENNLSAFHSTEDTILYPSGYHTNVGLFQALFGEADAIFSDEENHASIIDGCRLSKAKTYVFRHLDLDNLEEQLKKADAEDYRFKCIVTEGVFSMEADILDLPKYVALAKKYNAYIYLDECHSVGVLGKSGRGCIEYHGVDPNDIHIMSSTLGKAIGGGGGGYTTGKKAIIEYLRQTSRTFIFSNSLCTPIIGASLKALEIFEEDHGRFERLRLNGLRFRTKMRDNGFFIYGSDDCPVCPVLLFMPRPTRYIETGLYRLGYYTIGLAYPVIAKGTARVRIIVTATHTNEQIDGLAQAFKTLADEVNFFEEYHNPLIGPFMEGKIVKEDQYGFKPYQSKL